jgi:hypothetical protein
MQIKKTLNLPKELLEEAVKLSGSSTQTMAIVLALEEFVRKKRLEAILTLQGKGRITFGEESFLKSSRRR